LPHYKKMVGEKCYLSPLSMEDAEPFTRWENDLAVALPLGDEAFVPVSLEKSQEQVVEAIRNHSHVFGILDLATDQLIGRCMLFSLDLVNRSAMMGMMIGEKEYWDHGYGQEATRLLLDYGFNLLNLNSIMLGVYAFNERAIQAYRRVGFREIGRRRQVRIINGQKFDLLEMDILAEEFTPLYVKQFLPK
jgi:RimJ/RimL family protein N-acetyltransferase